MSKRIAVVDLSWLMYLNYYGRTADFVRDVDGGTGVAYLRPTGHVAGTVRHVMEAARMYHLVVLAVDGECRWRYETLPHYKEGRHPKSSESDPAKALTENYRVSRDLGLVLAACTRIPNVFYMKDPDLEADDIIAGFIAETLLPHDAGSPYIRAGYSPLTVLARDADILQTRGVYDLKFGVDKGPVDRYDYIKRRFKVECDCLPPLFKAVKGDKSDNISPWVPRVQSRVLCPVVPDSAGLDFQGCVELLRSRVYRRAGEALKRAIARLDYPDSDEYVSLKRRFDVVSARAVRPLKSGLMKSRAADDWLRESLKRLGAGYLYTALVSRDSSWCEVPA